MKLINVKVLYALLMIAAYSTHAQTTSRNDILSNQNVNVWKTTILPSSQQILKMHRHNYDRVVVPLTSGKLKITYQSGEIDYLTLQKGQAYYLPKNAIHSYHQDENLGEDLIEVIVIELKTTREKEI